MTQQTLIQIFARPPVAGKVKTRLIPEVGSESATAIYQHCLVRNLNMLERSGFEYHLWLSESSEDPIFNMHAEFIKVI